MTVDEWMEKALLEGTYQRRGDLHVDEVEPSVRNRPDQWVAAAIRCLGTAVETRNQRGWRVSVAMGFSLASHATPAGVNFASLDGIEGELDVAPPSLYLFDVDQEPWSSTTDFEELGPHYHPRGVVDVRAFFSEWFDENDRDYRRSVWLTA